MVSIIYTTNKHYALPRPRRSPLPRLKPRPRPRPRRSPLPRLSPRPLPRLSPRPLPLPRTAAATAIWAGTEEDIAVWNATAAPPPTRPGGSVAANLLAAGALAPDVPLPPAGSDIALLLLRGRFLVLLVLLLLLLLSCCPNSKAFFACSASCSKADGKGNGSAPRLKRPSNECSPWQHLHRGLSLSEK
jgi:hypothetical protein